MKKMFLTSMKCPHCGGRVVINMTQNKEEKWEMMDLQCKDCDTFINPEQYKEYEWKDHVIILGPTQTSLFTSSKQKETPDNVKILSRNSGEYVAFQWKEKPKYQDIASFVSSLSNDMQLPGWMEDAENIQSIAYEKYKLDWMLSHGWTLEVLFLQLDSLWSEEENPDDMAPSDYFNEFECNDAFGGSLYSCMNEFLNMEYKDKNYMKRLLDIPEYRAYLDDIMTTIIPDPVRRPLCKDCARCMELANTGDAICDYYGESVDPDTDFDCCTHFKYFGGEDACILLYDNYYVVDGIIAAADATELDAVDYFKDFGSDEEKKEIFSILNSSDYDPKLWRFSPMSC